MWNRFIDRARKRRKPILISAGSRSSGEKKARSHATARHVGFFLFLFSHAVAAHARTLNSRHTAEFFAV